MYTRNIARHQAVIELDKAVEVGNFKEAEKIIVKFRKKYGPMLSSADMKELHKSLNAEKAKFQQKQNPWLSDIDTLQGFTNGIIEQAAKDYQKALKCGDEGKAKSIRVFFRSNTFKLYTELDPEFLIEQLDLEAKKTQPQTTSRAKRSKRISKL